MTEEEIKALVRRELPQILQDREMRDHIARALNSYFAGKPETESRFDQLMEELRRDREEQSRKWEEQTHQWEEQNRRWEEQTHQWEEQNRRWEEQNRRWEENQGRIERIEQQINQILREIQRLDSKHDSTIGALGARWGIASEESFRHGLKAILEASFGVQVININEYDDQGEVFGRPEQVELDLLIQNGLLIICEIKSSMSKPDIYAFEKKVQFYQGRHQRQVNRKMVISPMVAPNAKEIAQRLGIEVYSYAQDIKTGSN